MFVPFFWPYPHGHEKNTPPKLALKLGHPIMIEDNMWEEIKENLLWNVNMFVVLCFLPKKSMHFCWLICRCYCRWSEWSHALCRSTGWCLSAIQNTETQHSCVYRMARMALWQRSELSDVKADTIFRFSFIPTRWTPSNCYKLELWSHKWWSPLSMAQIYGFP